MIQRFLRRGGWTAIFISVIFILSFGIAYWTMPWYAALAVFLSAYALDWASTFLVLTWGRISIEGESNSTVRWALKKFGVKWGLLIGGALNIIFPPRWWIKNFSASVLVSFIIFIFLGGLTLDVPLERIFLNGVAAMLLIMALRNVGAAINNVWISIERRLFFRWYY